MAKQKLRIDSVIDYRLSHSYAETLQQFKLTPGKFFRVVNEAYRDGVVDKDGKEQCLVIERPTLDNYLGEVIAGDRGKSPDGTHLSKKNNVNLVEIVLEPLVLKIPETPVSEAPKTPVTYQDASREQKIQIIREGVINHPAKDDSSPNGAFQFFKDHDLAGLMQNSPHLRKKDSPQALMELYDRERKLDLFDRSQLHYLGRWEIQEKGMWRGEKGRLLGVEAVEDVLWRLMPNYRDASREEKIRLIRKHVINHPAKDDGSQNGAAQFFRDHGLGGLMNSSPHLRKPGSPPALMESYDRERRLGLFDKSKGDYLVMREAS